MKKFLLIVFVMMVSWGMQAQTFPSEFWHSGKLILLNNDTLKGKIKYNMTADLVQIKLNNQIKTFTAQKILYFEIIDVTVEYMRRFITLPYKVQSNYKTPIIFELLQEGEITLLSREEVVEQTSTMSGYSPYYYSPYGTYSRLVLDYIFYFVDRKGNITRYSEKKRDLFNILNKRSRNVKSYMKKHNLKHDRKGDLTRIVAFYNSLI